MQKYSVLLILYVFIKQLYKSNAVIIRFIETTEPSSQPTFPTINLDQNFQGFDGKGIFHGDINRVVKGKSTKEVIN